MISNPTARAPYPGVPNFQHHAPNAALLIDFDNVTMGIRSDLGKELKSLLNSEVIRGKVAVQRAYADWRRYPQYIVPLAESSIDLIFAPAYGSSKKNATDLRMAIDAIELVFTRPEIGTFILMTGDSDFSSCVLKLKEYGKYVIGVGMRESSSDLLIQNCDEYYSYHSLSGLTRAGEVVDSKEDPWVLVKRAAQQMVANNDIMRTDRLKQVMLTLDPAFDEKKIGYSKFSKFVQEAATKGLVRLRKGENGQYEIVGAGAGEGAEAPAETVAPVARDNGRRGRGRDEGRRGPRDARPPREDREPAAVTAEPETAPEPVAAAPARVEDPAAFVADAAPAAETPAAAAPTASPVGPPDLQEAYALLQEAVRSLTAGQGKAVRDGDVKRKILAMAPGFDETSLGFSKFTRFLRQAHDAEVIDLNRVNGGNYEVSLPAGGRRLPAPKLTATAAAAPPAPSAPSAREEKPAARRDAPRREEPAAEAAPARPAAPAAPAAPAIRAPEAPVLPPAGALRGGRRGRGAPLEGPPPILPGQIVGRPAATAAAVAAPVEAPVADLPVAEAESQPTEERQAKGRSRRGGRGRGRGRTEASAPEAALEATPEPAPPEVPAAPVAAVEASVETEPAAQPAGRGRGRRGRGRGAAPAEEVGILPGQAVSAPIAEPVVTTTEEPADEPEAEADADAQEPAKRRRRSRSRSRKRAPEAAAAPAFSAIDLGLPTGREAVIGYVTGAYRGVGQKTAETLYDALGDDLFQTLQEAPDRIRELLGDRRAGTLLDQWTADFAGRDAGAEAPELPVETVAEAEPAAAEASSAARAKPRSRRGGRGRGRKRTDSPAKE